MSLKTRNTPPNAPYRSMGGEFDFEDCPCCGTTCTCCPDQICNKTFKFTLSNIEVTFFGTLYTAAVGPYCLTVHYDAKNGGYERWYAIELDTDIWLQIKLIGVFVCTNGEPSDSISWTAEAQFYVFHLSLRRAATHSRTWPSTPNSYPCDEIETAITGSFSDATVESSSASEFEACSVSGTGLIEGSISVAAGDCGDGATCCEHECTAGFYAGFCGVACCNNGATWFCDPDTIDANSYTATAISGPCNGAVGTLSGYQVSHHGTCSQWQLNMFGLDIAHPILDCSGNMYGYVGTHEGFCGTVYERMSIGSVTTVHDCDPLDFEITITAGDCAGTVFRITE